MLANIAKRAHDRQLETNTTWWEMHGGRVRGIINWCVENKWVTFLASLASITALIVAILTIIIRK